MQNISVIGAGSWGTALAQTLARAGRKVVLYARSETLATKINTAHENPDYLPGIALHPGLQATSDIKTSVSTAEAALLVMPAQNLREGAEELKKNALGENIPLVICCKGIEASSGLLLSAVLRQVLPLNPLAVLSGPSFAAEVAKGLPAALTLAVEKNNMAAGKKLAAALSGETFRPYLSDDPIGVQIGGALKNVIAIAAGIVAGAGLGENAKAATMTRGMAEMRRLGEDLGADPETFLGLSGMGDLVLTCGSMTSRNYSLGVMVGQGKTPADILKSRKGVTEGIATTDAALKLAAQRKTGMPLTRAVYDVLYKGADVRQIVRALLARPLAEETD